MKSDALAVAPIDPANPLRSLDERLEKTITDLIVGMPAEFHTAASMLIRAAFLAGFVSRQEVNQETANEWMQDTMNNAHKWIKADLLRHGTIVNRNSLKGNGS